MDERDLRLQILNTLLTTPHRALDAIYPVHKEMIEKDPRFYVQLAAWYAKEGEVRDHKEMFVINLALSKFEGHRDVGLALLRELPPYEVGRVVDFIKGSTEKVPVRKPRQRRQRAVRAQVQAQVPRPAPAPRLGLRQRIFGAGPALPAPPAPPPAPAPAAAAPAVPAEEPVEYQIVRHGLSLNVPRSLKTEVERYLREREADPEWFDGTVLVARKSVKRLYAGLHIQPGPRAQAVLFEDNPPEGSRLFALKQIAKAESPADQARAIVENQIPYRVAVSLVKQMTPTVMVALIDRMTPQEVINNMGSLKRHGVFENPDVKALVERKLEQAKTDGRVQAFKAKEAVKAAGVSADLEKKLDDITETRVKAKGTLKRPTALLIDKSGSMDQAIELGKRLGSMIAGITEAPLFVYAFDTMPYPIAPAGPDLTEWEKAFAGIVANGGTSVGVAVELMRRQKQVAEQFVVITDEAENQGPYFAPALAQYSKELAVAPNVLFVRTGSHTNQLELALQAVGIPSESFTFAGDYYALPNLVPMLTRPSRMDLLLEIMAFPLPKRKGGPHREAPAKAASAA